MNGRNLWDKYASREIKPSDLATSTSLEPIRFLLRDGTTQMARNPQSAGTASFSQIIAPGSWHSSLFLTEGVFRLTTSLLKMILPNSNV